MHFNLEPLRPTAAARQLTEFDIESQTVQHRVFFCLSLGGESLLFDLQSGYVQPGDACLTALSTTLLLLTLTGLNKAAELKSDAE